MGATVYNEVQLRRAWTTTREALNNPANRKLGLKALMINPTLAMHAIAYAAKEERDPTARNFLQACGVGESTLDVGASEGKIREYMTTLLYEDRKLLDYEQIRTDWQPDTLELTKVCWVQTCGRAQTKATPPLNSSQPTAIAALLGELDAAAGYLNPLLDAKEDDLEELLAPDGPVNHIARLEKVHACERRSSAMTLQTATRRRPRTGPITRRCSCSSSAFQSMAEDYEIRIETLLVTAKEAAA